MSDRAPASRSLPVLVIVIILSATMLRGPILSVAPVARTIGADLQVGAGVVGLLTTIPVLCFAVCAPLAIAIIRRAGADVALSLTLGGVVVGSVLRSLDGIVMALIGTAVLGAFVTIGNVVLPIIIAREFSARRAHTMTGVYTAALNVGTMMVTVGTAPLADVVGWRWAVMSWSVLGLVSLAAWIALRGVRAAFAPKPGPRPDADAPRISVLRHGPTWLLAAAFCGQAFAFYAITAWLPTLLTDQGFSSNAAGAIAAIFQVGGMIGSLLLPVITLRSSILVGALCVGIGWLAVPLGFLFAPSLWLAWCIIGGLAQGGGITVVFIMINAFGDDEHTTAGRSGIVQGLGYAVAAAGPLVLGALHEVTDAWTLPLLVELVAVLLFLVPGVIVARHLRTPARAA
ncbi:MFS transporter [Microbacterium protaetiae]|uniref:MFS transporter n=1 Tax=Microbacterium protaetiae TaxID=2509458 RepID=A0A4V0YD34_9MICO|nr:MFS transporter [Microbacterium protaetiae]QAY59321.1 MFS transporter [Microbacterium protaetiae]